MTLCFLIGTSLCWAEAPEDLDSLSPVNLDTGSLGPVFAPLTERSDLNVLNRLPGVAEAEYQNKQALTAESQQQAVGEVMGLETQSEAEKVIFHDDGTVEFRDNMQPLLLNQDILSAGTTESAVPLADSSLLRELDSESDYLLFTAPLSTESYEVTTEEKLIDPEAHQFLPGFQQAFDAMAQNDLTGTDATEPQTGLSSRKSKKNKLQKTEQRKPPVRPLQQSPPLPTIESIHITRLNRTPVPSETPPSSENTVPSPAQSENDLPLGSSSLPPDQPNASVSSQVDIQKQDIKRSVDPKPIHRVQRSQKTLGRNKAHKAKHLKTIDVSEKDWQPAKAAVHPAPQSNTDSGSSAEIDATSKTDSEGVSMPALQQEQAAEGTDAPKSEGREETLQDLIQRLESPSN